VSFYRTAVTILSFWKEKPSITYGELAHFLQAVVKSNSDELERDLESLLKLFADWKTRIKAGKRYYPQATEQLRRDIYFMLEWLCGLTGNREAFYFKKWSYKDRMPERWAELKEVIAYEEFELQQMFEDLVPYYVGVLTKNAYVKDAQDTYERLAKHESFWPWIRAFTDLHGSLNSGAPISFRQVRVLDYLLVITVRTEVLIRSIFRSFCEVEDPRDFSSVFNQFSHKWPERSPERKVLGTVADPANWKLTELSGKPDDIFGNIDTLVPKQNWNKSMHHIFISILRFVTARNYFAHHSFKDESLNNQVSDLARKVLVSCVETAVYIDSITHQYVTNRPPLDHP
jgi:hypothetical protein